MGDGLFWERKCCLSSEKQFPVLLGLLLSSSSSFPLPPEQKRNCQGCVQLLNSVSDCLSLSTLEVGCKNQIYFNKLGNRPNK